MPAPKKTVGWKGVFYIFKRLKLDKSVCSEIYPSWQKRPWRQTIIWTVFCVVLCVLKSSKKLWRRPSRGSFCGQTLYPDVRTEESLLFHWLFSMVFLLQIWCGNDFTFVLLQVPSHSARSKRSWTKLITYQWIFKMPQRAIRNWKSIFNWIYASALPLRTRDHFGVQSREQIYWCLHDTDFLWSQSFVEKIIYRSDTPFTVAPCSHQGKTGHEENINRYPCLRSPCVLPTCLEG